MISLHQTDDFIIEPCDSVLDVGRDHGLRTPNEGINQRNLNFWADVADNICFGRTYKLGIGISFLAVQ